MPSYSSCVQCAERLLQDIETDLESSDLSTFEVLDLLYMRWMAQRVLHRAKARAKRGASRRDLTPCQDHYGYRQLS